VNISSVWKIRTIGLLLLLSILVAACGSADSAAPTDAPEAAATQTPAPPTNMPAPSPTPEPEPDFVEYVDPEGDCLDNNNAPTACFPFGVDILTVTISRESPLTIVLEIAEDGFDVLRAFGFYGVIFGIDLDQDATTGNTSFWPGFHGIGPDIEIHYFEEDGEVVAQGVTHYAPEGRETEGNADLVAWTVLDNNHIQLVLSEELVPDQSFSISGDLFTPDLYDHFVDDGHLTFPEGEVILVD